MNEFIILLPVRCYTCNYILGKFQTEYEALIESGELSFENIIKLFNKESTDVEVIYEKRIRSRLFKIPMIRDCCLTNLLSPIILPEQIKPKYPNPVDPSKMVESISVGREVGGRAKTKFYTKTFSDISSKRKLPKLEEIGVPPAEVTEGTEGTILPEHGLISLPTPSVPSVPSSPSLPEMTSLPLELSPIVTPRQTIKAPMPPRLAPSPKHTTIKQLVPHRLPPVPTGTAGTAASPMFPSRFLPQTKMPLMPGIPGVRIDISNLSSIVKK
jgi:DNA-directed RNA polymerase subunit N (RpoN/RPB10)